MGHTEILERQRFWDRVELGGPDDCWEWRAACRRGGYGVITWAGRPEAAHRVAWILQEGPIPEGIHILHKCDNPPCVNPRHLFAGTPKDNMLDKIRKGRGGRWTETNPQKQRKVQQRNYQLKLTEDQVLQIRTLRAEGVKQAELARRFGVTEMNISLIVRRLGWKHLEDQP